MNYVNKKNTYSAGIFQNNPQIKGSLFTIDFNSWLKRTTIRFIVCIFIFIIVFIMKAINIDATNHILDVVQDKLNEEFNYIQGYNKVKEFAGRVSTFGEKAFAVFNIKGVETYPFIMPMEGTIDVANSKKIIIKGEEGQDILAAGEGVVIKTGSNKSFGTYIIIKHKGELLSVYKYAQNSKVQVNQKVVKGEVIGTSSSKLQFEVWYRNKSEDPMKYIENNVSSL